MDLKGKIIHNRYQIIQNIRNEDFYFCYKAEDLQEKKEVLVKILKQEKIASKTEAIIRYHNEIHLIARIQNDHLVKIFDTGEWESFHYIALEPFYASNLKEWMATGRNNIKNSVEIIKQICEALIALNQNQIIHKDLRPENILIDDSTEIKIKLTDFGLFYFNDLNQIIQEKKLMPSLYYIPPEQTRLIKRRIDNRSDLYSLGIIFYELLTGAPPFMEKDISLFLYRHLAQKPEKPSSVVNKIPPILDEIILKLLNKEPDERYQTAEGLKEDLDFFLKTPENEYFTIGLKDRTEKVNFDIRMIGRVKELETLKESFQKVSQSQPQMVLIQGESGVGKTKIVENFKEDILDETCRFLIFKCSSISKNIPFSAFVEIFKEYFEKVYRPEYQNEIIDLNQEKLTSLHNLFPFLKTIFPEIKSQEEEISVDKRKREIFENISRLFWTISRFKEKIVIFIDDIQYLDEDGMALLEFINENLRDCKLMIILSFTISEYSLTTHNIGKNPANFTSIWIESLDRPAIQMLIRKMFNQKIDVKDEFYNKIQQISLGNPLFIIQILKTLVDNGTIFNQEDKWVVNEDDFFKFELKNDIYEILLKRISYFTQDEMDILSMASVFGKEFELHQLNELFESVKGFSNIQKIITVIDKARKEHILEENHLKGTGYYSFQHDKIQDVLYHAIEDSEKKQMHLICAELLIKGDAANIDKNIYYIAYHYNQTNHKKNFLYYNEMASQKAFSQHSIREAIYYMKNIVDFHLKNKILDQNLISSILKMTKLAQTLGKIEESFEYLQKALEVAKANNWESDEIKITLQIGTGYYFLNDMTTSLSYYQKAIELAKKNNEEIKVAYPYTMTGSLYYFRSQLEEAEDFFTKAIEYIDESDLENRVRTYGVRAWTEILMGKIEEGFENVRVLESLIPKVENPMILSQIYHYCSICYSWSGKDPSKSISYSQLSYRYADQFNYTLFLYSSLCSKAIAYFHQERYDECLENIRKAIEFGEHYKILIGLSLMYGYQASAYLWKKEFKKADEVAVHFLEQKEKIPEQFAVLMFLNAHSVYLYYNDEPEESLKVVEEGLELYEKTGNNLMGVFLLRLKAQILEESRKNEELKIIQDKFDFLLKNRKGIEVFIKKADELMDILGKARIERAKQKSIEKANAAFKEKIQLEKIIQISQLFNSVMNMDEILKNILEKTMEITGAERGLLILYDNNYEEIKLSQNLEDKDFKIPEKIIREIKDTKKGIVWNASSLDDKHEKTVKSILCAPIILSERIGGFLYLDSFLLTNLFTERDLQVLIVFTTQVAWAVSMKNHFPSGKGVFKDFKQEKKEDLFEKYKITKREKEIISLVLQGFSNEEISKKIFVSLITVKIHIHNIYEKTQVKNRVELVNLFSKNS